MLQVVKFDEQLKEQILGLEKSCISICEGLQAAFSLKFLKLHVELTVSLIRNKKGKQAGPNHIFDDHYESSIEVGFVENQEYYPNAYIPIWKLKQDMFDKIGYLTEYNAHELEQKLTCILEEMYEERIEVVKEGKTID
ncbi:hypothetical protein [Bacillus dakarensis]|uniref:hypothetical protein n=1 Tax=Robertmurraya dakarensis TaxID=1926278 RepID=UPI000981AF54|nr:hypothetical protein [Bacillus dakarensis]